MNRSGRSPKMSDVSKSLRAIPSGRSKEMSDCERITQVAPHENERMSESLIFLCESLIFGQKTSALLRNPMSEFPALLINTCIHYQNMYTLVCISIIHTCISLSTYPLSIHVSTNQHVYPLSTHVSTCLHIHYLHMYPLVYVSTIHTCIH